MTYPLRYRNSFGLTSYNGMTSYKTRRLRECSDVEKRLGGVSRLEETIKKKKFEINKFPNKADLFAKSEKNLIDAEHSGLLCCHQHKGPSPAYHRPLCPPSPSTISRFPPCSPSRSTSTRSQQVHSTLSAVVRVRDAPTSSVSKAKLSQLKVSPGTLALSTMSFIPTLSTALSVLCFLTTIVALARVGAAAFSANQGPNKSQFEKPQTQQVMFDLQQFSEQPLSLAQLLKLSLGRLQEAGRDSEKGRAVEYVGGAELVRMPASSWNGARRPALLFRSRELMFFLLISIVNSLIAHDMQRRPCRTKTSRYLWRSLSCRGMYVAQLRPRPTHELILTLTPTAIPTETISSTARPQTPWAPRVSVTTLKTGRGSIMCHISTPSAAI